MCGYSNNLQWSVQFIYQFKTKSSQVPAQKHWQTLWNIRVISQRKQQIELNISSWAAQCRKKQEPADPGESVGFVQRLFRDSSTEWLHSRVNPTSGDSEVLDRDALKGPNRCGSSSAALTCCVTQTADKSSRSCRMAPPSCSVTQIKVCPRTSLEVAEDPDSYHRCTCAAAHFSQSLLRERLTQEPTAPGRCFISEDPPDLTWMNVRHVGGA